MTQVENGVFDRGPSRALLRLIRPFRGRLLAAALVFFVKDCPFWVLPLVTASIIDTVVGDGALVTLLVAGGAGAVAVLLNYPSNALFVRLSSVAVRRLAVRLRNALAHQLQELSIGFHARTSSSISQTKVVRDVENIEFMLQQSLGALLSAIGILVGAIAITATRAPAFIAVYALTVPIGIGLGRWLRSRARARNEDFRRRIEGLSSRVGEMSALLPVTRAHGLEYVAVERVSSSAQDVLDAALRLDRLNGRFGSLAWISYQLLGLCCLVAAGLAALSGVVPITPGDVVLLSTYFAILTQAITNTFALAPVVTRGMESLRSIGEVIQEPDVEQNAGKTVVDWVEGRIAFNDVTFAYGRHVALQKLDLDIAAGETIAFVGSSGSGKSTALNLALGFIRPSRGTIRIDGVDMQELDLRTVRRFISVVPQESILFEGSIRDNVAYGMDSVDDGAVREALREAHALEFVDRLPKGLNTMVGERGGALSGGQRQRLAIARALIRDPRVLLLDEATSALDVDSELAVRVALERLMRGRTVLVVAHRLSTIRAADRIVVLDRGRVAETGSHAELMARGGMYARLYGTATN